MTFREQAERIVFEARSMTFADAVELTELRIKAIFLDGEKSGIEAARQSINRIGEAA